MTEEADRAGRLGRATDWLTATGYGMGWSMIRAVPQGVADRAFTAGADAAFRRRGAATVQLARNLKRVLGPSATPATLAAVTRAGLRSYARYWQETFRLPSMDHDAVAASMLANLAGVEHVHAAIDAGRGIVMPLPHSGNWDIAGLAMAKRFGGITTVAERLKPAALFDDFVAYRESLGFEVLPLTGGPTRRPCSGSGCVRGRWSAWWPTATCPPAACGSSSSVSPPECRPVRRCWPRPPKPTCARPICIS